MYWVFLSSGLVFVLLVAWWINRRINKHDFDLNNPEPQKTYGNPWRIYKCRRCGESLGLDDWQMRSLPWHTAYGCPGSPPAINDHIDAVNACLKEKLED